MTLQPKNGNILLFQALADSGGGGAMQTDDKAIQSDFFNQIGEFTQILNILERMPRAMFMIKNLESRYVYMSASLRRAIHRDSPADVIGRTDFDLFPKIIAESFRQNDFLVFKHGKPLVNEVHVTCFFTQSPCWYFSSKYPVYGRDGDVVGLVTLNEPYEEMMGKQAELNRLLPAINYVLRNYAEPITIENLASLCDISESHFMRVFKQQLNMTAYSYVEQVRLFQAIELLKHGDTSITQIALDCGFYDHSAFVKRFRKFTGTTPLRYRRSRQPHVSSDQSFVLPKIDI